MLIVPLRAVPSQNFQTVLNGQSCQIAVYARFYGLHLDLSVNDVPIVSGVLCYNLNRIVRDAYLGFVGDLVFIDNEGTDDPVYTGLGGRFSLAYLTSADLATLS